MNSINKIAPETIEQGTPAWFNMVGTLMCKAAERHGLPADLTLHVIERYTDGSKIAEGLVQGLRFDVIDGLPSFRVGARPEERGDVNIEITAAAARALNLLRSADPAYGAVMEAFLTSGVMKVEGNLSQLGTWLQEIHDTIVKRTK